MYYSNQYYEQQQEGHSQHKKRDIVDSVFDSTTELCKSFVREAFLYSSTAIDGICAAIIHVS